MKPYQGILALVSYLALQFIVLARISMDYYEAISAIIASIVFGWLLHKKRMLPMSSRDLKGSQLLFCLGIGFGLSLFFKISILFSVLSDAPTYRQTPATPFSLAVSLVTATVLIPIVEELLFRGILFGAFSRAIPYKAAIVLSTVLFTLVHPMVSWPSIFVIGTLFAWFYWRTNNLAVPMVIHGAINFGSLLATPLYMLLTAHRTIGVIVCLLVVLLGVLITYLSAKRFLQKHDALPA